MATKKKQKKGRLALYVIIITVLTVFIANTVTTVYMGFRSRSLVLRDYIVQSSSLTEVYSEKIVAQIKQYIAELNPYVTADIV
ncbi:MAG: hypothetical protein K6F69_08110, partial [Treponema sp.]|nr:hypothetical protein [Treponema sp.]